MQVSDESCSAAGDLRCRCSEVERAIQASAGARSAEDALDRAGDSDGLQALRRALRAAHVDRQSAVIEIAELPSTSSADLKAKAQLLLRVIDEVDTAPELELARSMAHDVIAVLP